MSLPGDDELTRKRAWLIQLGVEPYGPIHALQSELVQWRQQDLIEDTLLLLEHTPVITLGRRADRAHILATPQSLESEGIVVHQTERGGDVTYHGPGQLVGYPILRLRSHNIGASDYMHRLEEVIMRALADYGLAAHRREREIGVWVGDRKIAAFGVRIKRGITFHGFALNVCPDMLHWSLIVPCGIADRGVTSMAMEICSAPPISDVRQRVVSHFEELFHLKLFPTTLHQLAEQAMQSIVASEQRATDDRGHAGHATTLTQRSRRL